MPLRMKKLPNKRLYRVYDGKRIISKGTTKDKAQKQVRLLRWLEHGMKLRGK